MKTLDIFNLEPTKVSRDIRDYDALIYAPSGIGKSEFILDLYGKERTLAIAFESSYSGISDAFVVDVATMADLTKVLSQLTNPKAREKYDVIVLDTLFLLDHMIEKSVTDAYGVDLVGDARKWNAGYKIIDKKFLDIIKKLQRMGYTLAYVAHTATKKVKVNGVEIEKYEPRVSDRIKNLLLPEVDIQLFGYTDGEGTRQIATQLSPYWDARCRVSSMPPIIEWDADKFKEEFAKGIDSKHKNSKLIVEKKESAIKEDRTFAQVMEYLTKDLAVKCSEAGKMTEANKIIVTALGRDDDGNHRTLAQAVPEMKDALEVIAVELECLLGIV